MPGADPGAAAVPGPGFRIGEYLIMDTIGLGAMSTVFRARDGTRHEVAMKVVRAGPHVSATVMERFRREAEASKILRPHPHIVTVYATGQEGPYHYIVMQLIRNHRTLESVLAQNEMRLEDLVRLVIKVAGALHYAHEHRIVHRDVKPSNIMLDEFGEPRLTDFGVAELQDWPNCTVDGALTGTPLYMAPEQARGERAGPASDQYALAVVLYEALTGEFPYPIQHFAPVQQVLEAIRAATPRSPRRHRPGISPALEAVILKALAREPGDRYPDAQSFARDLERALAGESVTARRAAWHERARGAWQRYRRTALPLAALLALGLGAAGYARHRLLQERYRGLLQQAQLANLRLAMEQPSAPAASNPAARAWQAIRRARQALAAEQWDAARTSLSLAMQSARASRDERTLAAAQYEMAHLESLRRNWPAALEYYRGILANPDAPPALLGEVRFDELCLRLLSSPGASVPAPAPFPDELEDARQCLAGRLPPDQLLTRLAYLPRRVMNKALLAAGLRYHFLGEHAKARDCLRRCAQLSVPPSDWPAPLAKLLYQEFPP